MSTPLSSPSHLAYNDFREAVLHLCGLIALRNLQLMDNDRATHKEFERWGMNPPSDDDLDSMIRMAREEVRRAGSLWHSTYG